ncbi:MAG: signal transduction histidine kinase [Pseudohongiellaceae bacterium]|jgi:signal transduction histidine kinase
MDIQEFFSSIIESMPSALITVDADLQIKQINENALAISNAADTSVLNTAVFESFPMLQSYSEEIITALKESRTVTLERVPYLVEDLNCYYKVSCYPLSAIPDVIVIQIDDVTQRELLEQRVLQTEKMHSMDGLAAGIAHEVNNPLSAIINGVQNISRRLSLSRPANQETAKALNVDLAKVNEYLEQREITFFLESIEEGALRASNIVSNMLKFSISNVHSTEPCDINLLLEQALKFVEKDYTLNNQSSFTDIKTELKLDSTLPQVKVLPMELQQVFVNLLRNAEQAISARKLEADAKYRGKITIETKIENGVVTVVVADNGCGMSDKVLRKVFDPYFSTRQKTGGHGLGLSTVYRIIKSLLGGEIEVRSAVNVGTAFIISLKLQK